MEGDYASFLAFLLSIALEIRQRGLVEGDDASFLAFNVSCFLHVSFLAFFMFRFLLSSCFVSCFLYASFHSLMRRSAVLYILQGTQIMTRV